MIQLSTEAKELFRSTEVKQLLQKNKINELVGLLSNYEPKEVGKELLAGVAEVGLILPKFEKIPKGMFLKSPITSITIPKNITGIGPWAFSSSDLNNINFEDDSKLVNIGQRAFESCSNLSQVNLPEGVTRIDPMTFAFCSALRTVYLPDSLVYIDRAAFLDCPNVVLYANSRKGLPPSKQLRVHASEVSWYKEHLKLNPTGGSNE